MFVGGFSIWTFRPDPEPYPTFSKIRISEEKRERERKEEAKKRYLDGKFDENRIIIGWRESTQQREGKNEKG